MPSLCDLKKRLNSVRTTGQLAGAMRTVSTAKYSRVNSMLSGYREYAEALHELADEIAGTNYADIASEAEGVRAVYVLLSGNRGLCGGYNHELFSYFEENVIGVSPVPPVIVTVGRMAAEHCREKGYAVYEEFSVSDVPKFGEAESLAELLDRVCAENEVACARFVYQRFINMMKHEPAVALYSPASAEESDYAEALKDCEDCQREYIFIPDEPSVRAELAPISDTSILYDLLLQCALGSQAATLIAMRSAYDNAMGSAQLLETAINRRRQSEVTQGVLETASDANTYL